MGTRELAVGGREGSLVITLQLETRGLTPSDTHGCAIEVEAVGHSQILLGDFLLGDVTANGFGLRFGLRLGDNNGLDGL